MPGAFRCGALTRSHHRAFPRGSITRPRRPQNRIGTKPAARDGGDPHTPRARTHQCPRAFPRRGAACEHIIHQQHIESAEASRRPEGTASHHSERPFNIRSTRRSSRRTLRRRKPDAREPSASHRDALHSPKLLRQQIRGTKAASGHAFGMGGHRHDHIESRPRSSRIQTLQGFVRQLRERRYQGVIAPALPTRQQRSRRPAVTHRRRSTHKKRRTLSAVFTNRCPIGHAARSPAPST